MGQQSAGMYDDEDFRNRNWIPGQDDPETPGTPAPAVGEKPAPIPAPDFDQLFNRSANPGEDQQAWQQRQTQLGEAGALGPIRPRFSDPAAEQAAQEGDQRAAQLARTQMERGLEQQNKEANRQQESDWRDQQRQQAAQQRAAAKAASDQQRGQTNILRDQGVKLQRDATGLGWEPVKKPDGSLAYNPDVSPPYQNADGTWVRWQRDEAGNQKEIDLLAQKQFTTDRETGDQYVMHAGEKIIIGKDDAIVRRNELRVQQDDLRAYTAQDTFDVQQAADAHRETKAALREAQKAAADPIKAYTLAQKNADAMASLGQAMPGVQQAALESAKKDYAEAMATLKPLQAEEQAAAGELKARMDLRQANILKLAQIASDIRKTQLVRRGALPETVLGQTVPDVAGEQSDVQEMAKGAADTVEELKTKRDLGLITADAYEAQKDAAEAPVEEASKQVEAKDAAMRAMDAKLAPIRKQLEAAKAKGEDPETVNKLVVDHNTELQRGLEAVNGAELKPDAQGDVSPAAFAARVAARATSTDDTYTGAAAKLTDELAKSGAKTIGGQPVEDAAAAVKTPPTLLDILGRNQLHEITPSLDFEPKSITLQTPQGPAGEFLIPRIDDGTPKVAREGDKYEPLGMSAEERQIRTDAYEGAKRQMETAKAALADAKAGKKPYQVDKDNAPVLVPGKEAVGVRQAVADGIISPDWADENLPKLQEAQDKFQKLIKDAGGYSQAKALLKGAGIGAAFWAGSIPGAKAGAMAGAMVPGAGETGISEAAGAVIGGLASGAAASWAAKKALSKVGEYSDAVKSLNASGELHPYYEAGGELAGMSINAPKAMLNLRSLYQIAAEDAGKAAALKLVGKQIGVSALSGAAFETTIRPAFDKAVQVGQKTFGLDAQDVQAPTVQSVLTNMALGVVTAGHNLQFKDYSAAEVASIMARAKVRRDAGLGMSDNVPMPQMVEAFKKAGIELDSAGAQEWSRPLSREEVEVYGALNRKVSAMQGSGLFDAGAQPEFSGARQASYSGFGGRRYPATSAAVGVKPGEAGGGTEAKGPTSPGGNGGLTAPVGPKPGPMPETDAHTLTVLGGAHDALSEAVKSDAALAAHNDERAKQGQPPLTMPQAHDALELVEGQQHAVQHRLAVPPVPVVQKMLAQVDPQADGASIVEHLKENPLALGAATSIGAQSRDEVYTPEQNRRLDLLASRGTDAARGTLAANTVAGAHVLSALEPIAKGQNEVAIPDSAVNALQRGGFVVENADGSRQVTPAGVALLPKELRTAIGREPSKFNVWLPSKPSSNGAEIAGNAADAGAQAVREVAAQIQTGRSGEEETGSGASPSLPVSPSPALVRPFRVQIEATHPTLGKKAPQTIVVPAHSPEEAEAIARQRVAKTGATVEKATAEPLEKGRSGEAEKQNTTPRNEQSGTLAATPASAQKGTTSPAEPELRPAASIVAKPPGSPASPEATKGEATSSPSTSPKTPGTPPALLAARKAIQKAMVQEGVAKAFKAAGIPVQRLKKAQDMGWIGIQWYNPEDGTPDIRLAFSDTALADILEQRFAGGTSSEAAQNYVRLAIGEELEHAADFEAIRRMWVEEGQPGTYREFVDKLSLDLWKQLTATQKKNVRASYLANLPPSVQGKITEVHLAREAVRQVRQMRAGGQTTEEFAPAWKKLMEKVLAVIKEWAANLSKAPQALREAIERLEAVRAEWDEMAAKTGRSGEEESGVAKPESPAAPPEASPTGEAKAEPAAEWQSAERAPVEPTPAPGKSKPEQTAEILNDLLQRAAQRAMDEAQAQEVLDQMDEHGIKPSAVVEKFWRETYPYLSARQQGRFQRMVKAVTGMQPGDVIGVRGIGPSQERFIAKDWPEVFPPEDAGEKAHDLEGTARGLVVLMDAANNGAGQIKPAVAREVGPVAALPAAEEGNAEAQRSAESKPEENIQHPISNVEPATSTAAPAPEKVEAAPAVADQAETVVADAHETFDKQKKAWLAGKREQPSDPVATPKVMKVQKAYLLDALDKAIAEAPEAMQATDATPDGETLAKAKQDGYTGTGDYWPKVVAALPDELLAKYGMRRAMTMEDMTHLSPEARVGVEKAAPTKEWDIAKELEHRIEMRGYALQPQITIEVPGDGTFRIINAQPALKAFRKTVEKEFPVRTAPTDFKGPRPVVTAPTKIPELGKPKVPADYVKLAGFSASNDTTRAVLMNVQSDGKNLVATDGRRMVILTGTKVPGSAKTPGFYDPKTAKPVKAPGPWPNWQQNVPSETQRFKIDLQNVDSGALMKLLFQAEEMTSEKSNAVVLWRDASGALGVTSSDPDMGMFAGGSDPQTSKFLTAVNPQYLLDALRIARGLGHGQVTIQFNDARDPLLITAPGMKYVLMPMRVEGGVERHPLDEAGGKEAENGRLGEGEKAAAKPVEPTKEVSISYLDKAGKDRAMDVRPEDVEEAKKAIRDEGGEVQMVDGKWETPTTAAGERQMANPIIDAEAKRREEAKKQPAPSNAEGAEVGGGGEKSEPPKAGIQDFGEKLGGARKDIAASMNREISDDDIARLPLSEIWPKAEVDAIADIPLAALATAVRAEIPAKPRQGYKVRQWAEKVKQVRGLMKIAGERGYEAVMAKMGEYRLEQLANKIRMLQSVPREHWGRIGRVEDHPDAYQYQHDAKGGVIFENGQMAKKPAPFAAADVDDRPIKATNLSELTDKVNAKLAGEAPEAKLQFEVRGREGKGWFINKKGDPLYRKLKTFENSKEAMAFARNPENYGTLKSAWDAVKESDNVKETDVRRETNRDRSGKDWRLGKDATPQMFMDSFGFRGAEFGNWVSQGKNTKERQGMLNAAFDALHDLAETVGIPPKAISLNGTLGLGFGSRGHGWASAHFEPGNLVINLTKTRGAGALAHEWFHALDNYFQRKRNEAGIVGRHGDYITNNPETYYENPTGQRLTERRYKELASRPVNAGRMNDWQRVEGVRPEVAEAFAELVKVLDASPMNARAKLIDKGKSDGYWSRTIERAARSFEGYVIGKMQLAGASNDYLANVTSVEDFARDKGRYPYLLPDELAPVSAAFDQLFSTMQSKPTEKGEMLYAPGMGAEPGKITTTIDELRKALYEQLHAPAGRSELRPGETGRTQGAEVSGLRSGEGQVSEPWPGGAGGQAAHAGATRGYSGPATPSNRRIEAARSFISSAGDLRGHLQRLGIRQQAVAHEQVRGGMTMAPDGTLLYNLDAIEENASKPEVADRRAFIESMLLEELAHRAHDLVSSDVNGESASIFNSLPGYTQQLVMEAYPSPYEPWRHGKEYLRMLTQLRAGWPITESLYKDTAELDRVLSEDQGPLTEALVKKIGDMLVSGRAPAASGGNVVPPAHAGEVAGQSEEPPAVPGKTPLELFNKNRGLAGYLADRFANIRGGMDREDVQQEALKALHDAARKYDASKGEFGAFAGRIIRNRLIDHYQDGEKLAKREVASLNEPQARDKENGRRGDEEKIANVADASLEPVGDQVAKREEAEILRQEIGRLGKRAQAVLIGHMQRKTFEQIGAELGMAKQAAQQWYAKAMKILKERLKARGVERGQTGRRGDLEKGSEAKASPSLPVSSSPGLQLAPGMIDAQQVRDERDRILKGDEPQEVTPVYSSTMSDLYADVFQGRLDKLDHYVPGAKAAILKGERADAWVRAAMREMMDSVKRDINLALGKSKDPAGKLRRKEFTAELLPVAARLNPVGYEQGNFVFKDFKMRAGQLREGLVEAEGAKGVFITTRKNYDAKVEAGANWSLVRELTTGQQFPGRHGELLEIGPLIDQAQNGKRFYQLLRPMSAERQQAIYDDFHEKYPEVAHWLDSFIAPGEEKSRIVDRRGTSLPDFNRHALRDFFGEQSPFGEIANVEGYTPEVMRTRSIAGAIAGAVRNMLNRNWQSGARDYKSGYAREEGTVRNLFEGFQIRAMEAHAERIRRQQAEALLQKAAKPISPDGIPNDGWVPLNAGTANVVADAMRLAAKLDRDKFPNITDALNPTDNDRLKVLFGESYKLFGKDADKMIRVEALAELVRPLASSRINNRALAMFDKAMRSYTGSLLVSPFTIGWNALGNEIFKTLRASQQALYGTMMHGVAGYRKLQGDLSGAQAAAGQGTKGLMEAGYLVRGMVWDRYFSPQTRALINELVPKEWFEGNTSIAGAVTAIEEGSMSAWDHLKQANVPQAILKAVRYGDIDVRAKQQMVYASYMAQAQVAAQQSGIKFPDKAARLEWMKNWLKNDADEGVHGRAYQCAMLYAMDYANVPALLDQGAQWKYKGKDITPYVNLARKLIMPFANWPYNYARQIKRLGADSILNLLWRNQAMQRGMSKVGLGAYGPEKVANTAQKVASLANLGAYALLMVAAKLLFDQGKDALDSGGVSKIGRSYDAEGKKLDAGLDTSSRVNITGTPLGKAVAATAQMFGDDAEHTDYWLRVRTMPYASAMLMAASAFHAVTSSGDKAGAQQAKDDFSGFIDDFVSTGIALKLGGALIGQPSKYDAGKNYSTLLGETAADLALARVAPGPLRQMAKDLIDPQQRREKPADNLGFNPGFGTGLVSNLPFASRVLPPAGRIITHSLASDKRDKYGLTPMEEYAQLAAKGFPDAMKVHPDKKGKPVMTMVDPQALYTKPRWQTLARAAMMNIKGVNREQYEAAVNRGGGD